MFNKKRLAEPSITQLVIGAVYQQTSEMNLLTLF